MKKLFILLLFLPAKFLFCQDTLVKYNGDRLLVKILEIYPQEISYKRTDLPDGPLYIEKKSSIKYVAFINGLTERFDLDEIKTEFIKPSGSKKIITVGNHYIVEELKYDPNTINFVLASSKDPRVISTLKLYREDKKMQKSAFIGIPFAVAAYYLILSAGESNPVLQPAGLISLGVFCLGAGIALPLQSIKFHKRAKADQLHAVQLYNESF